MGVAQPIPVSLADLEGKFWAQARADQYGMPYILVDYRLPESRYRDSALHEVCHLRLKHLEVDLTDDEKEAEVKSCMRAYRARAKPRHRP